MTTNTVAELRAKREVTQRTLAEMTQPIRALEQAQRELETLNHEFELAVRADVEAKNAARDKQNTIATEYAAYHAVTFELRDELRRIYSARQRLIAMGEPDPGDRVISVQEIVQPIMEGLKKQQQDMLR